MKYFSSKVATSETFCNRAKERKDLIQNIQNNEHYVVVAPRRYGKTSLVMQSLEESKLPFAKIDLFCVVYEEEVTRKIARGVSEIMQQIMTFSEKAITFLEGTFKSSTVGFKAGGFDVSVDFSRRTSPIEHIEDLLEGLEKIAAQNQQKAVLFLDEFQDILKLDESSKIQAAIRSVSQHSKYITYIFSGSSRVMLEKIFDDANQPLYMMCKKLMLGRISREHFKAHIQKATKGRWNQKR